MRDEYKMEKLKFIGIFVFLLGFIVLFFSSGIITGFVISEQINNIGSDYFFIFGLVIMLIGVMMMISREVIEDRTDSGLEIITTEHFMRAIKKHDLGAINRAIKKIGTGKGGEEKLRKGHYAIRVSKDARIIYDINQRKIVLEDYIPHHEYSRAL